MTLTSVLPRLLILLLALPALAGAADGNTEFGGHTKLIQKVGTITVELETDSHGGKVRNGKVAGCGNGRETAGTQAQYDCPHHGSHRRVHIDQRRRYVVVEDRLLQLTRL